MKQLLTFWAVVFAMTALAQEEQKTPDYGDFTIDAQVRARGEFRTGLGTFDDGSTPSKLFVNERVRLSFGWERKNLSLKVAAQHVGLWQGSGQKNTSGNITLHEAWARMTFGKGFFAQAGRQELSYDDERLFGAHDWAASGRAHDALRLGWENSRNKLHAIVSFNQTAEVVDDISAVGRTNSNAKLYKNMQTLWYHFGRDEAPFQISGVFVNQGVSDANGNGVNYLQTLGTYATFAKRKFSADASLYYQTGSDRTGTSVSAFRMGANFGWQFTRKWNVTLGEDYLSGSDGMPGKNRTFNLLYGSYHKFLGAMDCFGYGTIPSYGLNDLNVGTQFKPNQKFDMSLFCHWLVAGRPINDYLKDPTEKLTDPAKIQIMRQYYGKYRFTQNLGTEVDLQASYRPWKYVGIDAGFSMLFSTETIQLLKNSDASTFQSWGWLSLNIDPTVFSTRHWR